MNRRRVLLVEDEEELLKDFAATLTENGYEVRTAQDGDKAWGIFQGQVFLVVVTDLLMPGKDGLEVLKDIKRLSPATRVIIMTGFGGEEYILNALKLHANDYIIKASENSTHELLKAIERAFIEAETQIEAEKAMLDFLTHTLSGTISGGPETVNQVLSFAQSALGDRYSESDVYRMINNIGSLKATFESMANMLEAYKLYVNEPGKLRQRWEEDRGGAATLNYLLSSVLRQSLASLLFKGGNLGQFKHLLAMQEKYSIAQVRESFLTKAFWPGLLAEGENEVFEWLGEYFPVANVNIENSNLYFNLHGTRYPFLFALFTEVVYNALKYNDCREPIHISWRHRGDTYVFSCSNTFSEASTRQVGTQGGIAFMSALTQMIEGIDFFHESNGGRFTAEFSFKESLLD